MDLGRKGLHRDVPGRSLSPRLVMSASGELAHNPIRLALLLV